MPLTLTFISGTFGKSVALVSERCVIGRDPTCDLVLADPAVEGRHAILRAWEGEWVILGESRTSVGCVPLRKGVPRIVRPGDRILIGQAVLELREVATPTLDEPKATRELALQAVRAALRGHGHPEVPTVRIAEGANIRTTLALVEDGKTYSIGRGKTSDLCLSDAAASRTHLHVVRRGDHVFLRHPGSSSGVLVGSNPLPQGVEVAWTPALMVVLGGTVLTLDLALESAIEHFLEKQPLAALEILSATPESDVGPQIAAAIGPCAPNPVELSVRSPSPIAEVIHGATSRRIRPRSMQRETIFLIGILAISFAVCGSIAWLLYSSGR